jgi:ATP-dependent RNA helicase DDX27
VSDYNKDTWDDLMKYVKKRTRGKTEDKIVKVIEARDKEQVDSDSGSEKEDEFALSDDELKHDNL